VENINGRLAGLKETAWQLAADCRDEGNTEAFRVLVDFSERLAYLIRGKETAANPSGNGNPKSGLIDIFSPPGTYGGHLARLDLSRWKGKASKCVLREGVWVSLSKAGGSITGYAIRGPEWWKYDRGGELVPVSELKGSG